MVNPEPASALEVFFEQEAWLHRLARRLVQDDAAAQDLVQDTWLAALQNPPEDLTRPRAWLSAVAKRLASKQRAKLKPTLGEPLDSRASDIERPGWAAVRFETGTQLRQAVDSLREPLKTTILLRFMERLPQAEIARRMGVTERSVRNRTQAALDQIRLDLDHGIEGNEMGSLSWAVVLAPLLGPSDLTAPAPVASAAAGSGGLPSVALLASVAAVVIATASIAWVAAGGGFSSPEVPELTTTAGALTEAGALSDRSKVGEAEGAVSPIDRGERRPGVLPDEGETEDSQEQTTELEEGDPALASTAQARITGILMIDGKAATGLKVTVLDLSGNLDQLPSEPGLVDAFGSFGVDLPALGDYEISISAARDPVRTLPSGASVNSRIAGPTIHLHRQATESDENPVTRVEFWTGDVILVGVSREPNHKGHTLALTEADWSYESFALNVGLNGRMDFVQVPEGSISLTGGGVNLALDVRRGEVLTYNLLTNEANYRPR